MVQGRAEDQETDRFGVAVAKALAPPHVAAEWCLPLVRPGGAAVLWVGQTAEVERVGRVVERLGGRFRMESQPGHGALLSIHFPLDGRRPISERDIA